MRNPEHTLTLPDGTAVGYALWSRNGVFRVSFSVSGERKRVSTGARTLANAHNEARKIIVEAHGDRGKPVTFDTAISEIERTSKLRPDTLRCYRCCLAALKRIHPHIKQPCDVTPELAQRFKREYLATGTKVSCRTYLRALRSLWSKHFRELGYVTSNPWDQVSYPDVAPKPVVIPPEESIRKFLTWIADPLARLFVRVKALAGCRTWDLCQVRSVDLTGGCLVLRKEASKTERERVIPLPADVYAELESVKSDPWLWGSYAGRFQFQPRTWYWRISSMFKTYNKAHPDARVKPHDFRKRAITLLAKATGSVEATANAIGVDPQTARRYYIDAQRAYEGKELLVKMQGELDCAETVPESR